VTQNNSVTRGWDDAVSAQADADRNQATPSAPIRKRESRTHLPKFDQTYATTSPVPVIVVVRLGAR
jgi:hypothetical protein